MGEPAAQAAPAKAAGLSEAAWFARLLLVAGAGCGAFWAAQEAAAAAGLSRTAVFYALAVLVQAAPAVLLAGRARRAPPGAERRLYGLAALAKTSMALATVGYAASLLAARPGGREQALGGFLLGDIPSLLALPLLAAAALQLPRASSRLTGGLRDAVDGLLTAAGLLFAAWPAVLGPLYRESNTTGFRKEFALLSVAGDLVLLGTLAFVASRPARVRLAGAGVLGGGLAAAGAAGLVQWLHYVHPSLRWLDPLVDVLFVLSSVLMGAAALKGAGLPPGPLAAGWDLRRQKVANVLRALPLSTAAAAMLALLLVSPQRLDALLGWLLLAIAGLLLLGDQLALREVNALSADLARENAALQQAQVEIARLNGALAEQVRRLEESNRELESFSHSVSHDLRAPLRAVDGFARAMEEDHGASLDADARHALARIRAGSQRLGQIIDDLLALSRVSRGPVQRARLDLAALARQVAEGLVRAGPARAVEWVLPAELWVEADPGLVRILLENLLGNAWKYTSRKPAARIELGARDEEGLRIFFVRDDGAGFDMAFSSRLFKPFERLHPRSEFDGTGIGLATVHRIVRRHGGQVRAEAAPGAGATFLFTLG